MQALALLAVFFLTPAVFAAEIHVAPQGSDAIGNGSAQSPFATQERAAAALGARTEAQHREASVVVFHAGTYVFARTVNLGSAQSGTAQAPVTWRAAGDGVVRFTGGIAIPAEAMREVKEDATLARLPQRRDPGTRLYEIRLSDLGLTGFPSFSARSMGNYRHGIDTAPNRQETPPAAWPELVRNGTPLPLAAWPDGTTYTGGFKPAKILQSDTVEFAQDATPASDAKPMVFLAPDTARAARWKTALEKYGAALWFGGHWRWDWADDFLPAASIGKNGAVTLGLQHRYGMASEHANLRAYNLLEEMDREGEYALEPIQKRILVLLDPAKRGKLLLTWLGTPVLSLSQAAFVRIEGLFFSDSRSCAVDIANSHDVLIQRCGFQRTGDTSIRANGERIVVRDCVFTTLGGSAVRMNGGDRKTLTASGNVVEHCRVVDCSRLLRTYAPAFKVGGVGCTIANNVISKAPHSAILFAGNEHRIRDNDISEVLTETGDCGAIYGGRDWTAFGTVISGNWIHQFRRGRDTCGIYLDDQLSGVTVRGNYVDGGVMGILVGGGRYNSVSENIFAHCDTAIHLDARGAGWAKSKFRQTLVDRLKAVPAGREPWISRYPQVGRTLTDRPDLPVGTQITRNALVACRRDLGADATAQSAAVVAPNFEKLPSNSLVGQGDKTKVEGTSITFTTPKAGPGNTK